MEKKRTEEKNKKFTSTIKNKMFKGYEKIRNKINTNLDTYDSFQRMSYDNERVIPVIPYNIEKLNNNSTGRNKDIFLKNNYNSIMNIDIQHLSKIKKDDYNNILNSLFFTTSDIINTQKYLRNKKQNINNHNIKDSPNNNINEKEKNKILNKLFPDINEIKKYSHLPFFSLIKVKSPYKIKINLKSKKEIFRKFPQEEFLYKISHNNIDDEKINYNFLKHKGIKKGRTTKYYHGVNKFCINNKISETNFYKEDNLNKKQLKLKLEISNLTKGGDGMVPQISSKEKHIKILQNNLKNIKLIPKQLINDLEEGVFKFIDEEFDKKNDEKIDNNNKAENNKINSKKEANINNNKSNNTNIINLNTQFQMNKMNNKNKSNKTLQTENDYQKGAKSNNSFYNNSFNFNSSGFKKPLQYPINFYSTQQVRIKEHFNKTYKNTFDERNKKLRQGNNSERNVKKKLSDEILNNVNELHKRKVMTNKFAYNKESRIRDIIIGNKLKCEFTPIDIKRILNGLKPWVDIKLDQEIDSNIDSIKNDQS